MAENQSNPLSGNSVNPDVCALEKWLESRRSRPSETVKLCQIVDFLLDRGMSSEDAYCLASIVNLDGLNLFDIQATLQLLKRAEFRTFPIMILQGLDAASQSMQQCSLFPGPLDLHAKIDNVYSHANNILNFLRLAQSDASFFATVGPELSASLLERRLTVINHWVSHFRIHVDTLSCGSLTSSVVSCVKRIEVSSSAHTIKNLTDGDAATYWQSDGQAQSHWIRVYCANHVIVSDLFIWVNSEDSSYMPQHIGIYTGIQVGKTEAVKTCVLSHNFSGEYHIELNLQKPVSFVEIRIHRCQNDGCDTRIRGLRLEGNIYSINSKNKQEPNSLTDVAIQWHLDMVLALLQTSLPLCSILKSQVLNSFHGVLDQLTPLCLTSVSGQEACFFSPENVGKVQSFLYNIRPSLSNQTEKDTVGLVLVKLAAAGGDINGLINVVKVYAEEDFSETLSISDLWESLFVKMRSCTVNLPLKIDKCVKGDNQENLENRMLAAATWHGVSNKKPLYIWLSYDDSCKLNHWFQPLLVSVKLSKKDFSNQKKIMMEAKGATELKGVYPKCMNVTQINTVKILPSTDLSNLVSWELHPTVVTALHLCFSFDDISSSTDILSVKVEGLPCQRTPPTNSFYFFKSANDCKDDGISLLCLKYAEDLLMYDWFFVRLFAETKSIANVDLLQFSSFLDCFHSIFSSNSCCRNNRIVQKYFFQVLYMCLALSNGVSLNQQNKNPEAASKLLDAIMQFLQSAEGEMALLAEKTIIDNGHLFFPDMVKCRTHFMELLAELGSSQNTSMNNVMFASLCKMFTSAQHSGKLMVLPTIPSEVSNMTVSSIDPLLVLLAVLQRLSISKNQQCASATHMTLVANLVNMQQMRLFAWHSKTVKNASLEQELSVRRKCDEMLLTVMQHLISEVIVVVQEVDAAGLASVPNLLEGNLVWGVFGNFICLTMNLVQSDLLAFKMSEVDHLLPVWKSLLQLMAEKKFHNGWLTLTTVNHSAGSDLALQSSAVNVHSWEMESPHPCRASCFDADYSEVIFQAPGATSFVIQFDDECELAEKRNDRLIFQTSCGTQRIIKGLRKHDKSTHEDWPERLELASDNWLHFRYLSGSDEGAQQLDNLYEVGASFWGFKFTVNARMASVPETVGTFCVSFSKFLGIMCNLVLRYHPLSDIEKSVIWKTFFSKGKIEDTIGLQDKETLVHSIIVDLAHIPDSLEEIHTLLRKITQPPIPIASNSKLRDCVFATFQALMWHVPAYRTALAQILEGTQRENEDYTNLSANCETAYAHGTTLGFRLIGRKQALTTSAADTDSAASDSESQADQLYSACFERAEYLLKFLPYVAETDSKTSSVEKLLIDFIFNSQFCVEEINSFYTDKLQAQQLYIEVWQLCQGFLKMNSSPDQLVHVVSFVTKMLGTKNSDHLLLEKFAPKATELECTSMYVLHLLVKLMQHARSTRDKVVAIGTVYHLLIRAFNNQMIMALNGDLAVELVKLIVEVALKMDEEWQVMPGPFPTATIDELFPLKTFDLFRDFLVIVQGDSSGLDQFTESLHDPSVTTLERRKLMHLFVAVYRKLLGKKVTTTCDGCRSDSMGRVIYRCFECTDVDLCKECFQVGLAPWEHKTWHNMALLEYQCDACKGFILGTRYHCLDPACNDDYDLCRGCHAAVSGGSAAQFTKKAVHCMDHATQEFPMNIVHSVDPGVKHMLNYLQPLSWLLLSVFSCRSDSALIHNKLVEVLMGILHDRISACGSEQLDQKTCNILAVFGLKIESMTEENSTEWIEDILFLLKLEHMFQLPWLPLTEKILVKLGPKRSDRIFNKLFTFGTEVSVDGYVTINCVFSTVLGSLENRALSESCAVAQLLANLLGSTEWIPAVETVLKAKLEEKSVSALFFLGGLWHSWYPGMKVEFCNQYFTWKEGILLGFGLDQMLAMVLEPFSRAQKYISLDDNEIRLKSVTIPKNFAADWPWLTAKMEKLQDKKDLQLEDALLVKLLVGMDLSLIPFNTVFEIFSNIACLPTGFANDIAVEVFEVSIIQLLVTDQKRFDNAVCKRNEHLAPSAYDDVCETLKDDHKIPVMLSEAIRLREPNQMHWHPVWRTSDKKQVANVIQWMLLTKQSPVLSPNTLLFFIPTQKVEEEETKEYGRNPEFCAVDRGVRKLQNVDWKNASLSDAAIEVEQETAQSRKTQDSHIDAATGHSGILIENVHEAEEGAFENYTELSQSKLKPNNNLRSMLLIFNAVMKMLEKYPSKTDGFYADWESQLCQAYVVLNCRKLLCEWFKRVDVPSDWFETKFGEPNEVLVRRLLEIIGVLSTTCSLNGNVKEMVGAVLSWINAVSNVDDRNSSEKSFLIAAYHTMYEALPSVKYHHVLLKSHGEEIIKTIHLDDHGDFVTLEVDVLQAMNNDNTEFRSTSLQIKNGCTDVHMAYVGKKWSPSSVKVSGKEVTLVFKYLPLFVPIKCVIKATATPVLGRFNVGYEALTALLLYVRKRAPELMQKWMCEMQVAHLWTVCVYLSCRFTGDRRLKLIALLCQLLRLQLECTDAVQLNLNVLAPLWKYLQSESKSSPLKSCKPPSTIARALIELFHLAEMCALGSKNKPGYLLAMWTPDQNARLSKAIGRGFYLVGAIGAAIDMPNKATVVSREIIARKTNSALSGADSVAFSAAVSTTENSETEVSTDLEDEAGFRLPSPPLTDVSGSYSSSMLSMYSCDDSF